MRSAYDFLGNQWASPEQLDQQHSRSNAELLRSSFGGAVNHPTAFLK
jgi:hypothetical protein